MAGASIEVRIEDRDHARAFFARLQHMMSDTTPVMKIIGTGLVGNIQRRFSGPRDWPPLNPAYAATKRNRHMLVESKALRDSISEQAGNDYVRIGTNKVYAAIQHFGGVIRPKKASHLFFKLGSGYVRAKSVTIPARPWLTIEPEDEEMIAEIIFFRIQQLRG